MTFKGERAIVAGAGISGLLAARVLADHYEQVLLVERDRFPPPGETRKGTPQARHTHALLTRGREVLEELFPGLSAELIARGALPYDQLADMRRFIGGGFYTRGRSGLESLMMSRALLEFHVRARLLALPNIRAVEQCDVLGLVASADRSRVTGVRLIRHEPGSAEEVCAADIVVDATGRASRTPSWLEALGYPAPEEDRVEIGVGYATRYFARESRQLDGDLGVLIMPTPAHKRLGVVVAQEGLRWAVTLVGYRGDAPPTDDAGFLEFARGLAAPEIHELIRTAQPLGPAIGARIPSNVRRRYDRMPRFPEGLIITGEALFSFNPAYAQGMTVAALEAIALRDSLERGARGLAARYLAAAMAAIVGVWRITVGGDLRIMKPARPRRARERLLEWYLGRLHVAAREDLIPAVAFMRVAGLLAAPAELLRPRVAARVLTHDLRRARRDAPQSRAREQHASTAPDSVSGLIPSTPKTRGIS